MSKQTNSSAFRALDAFATATDASRVALVAALTECGFSTRESVDPIVTEWASLRTGCPLVDGQRKAAGRKVFDSAHPAFENARKTRQRVMDAFCPAEKPAKKTEPAKEASPLTKAEIAALMAALAACGGNVARAVAGLKALAA